MEVMAITVEAELLTHLVGSISILTMDFHVGPISISLPESEGQVQSFHR